MKKFLALILALVLAFSLSSVAFAATVTIDGRTTSPNVPDGSANWAKNNSVKVSVSGEVTHVYYVDITWGNLSFAYNNSTSVWDPENHQYVDSSTVGAGWGGHTSTDITVENHSDLPVWLTVTYADGASVSGVNVNYNDTDSKALSAATPTSNGTADHKYVGTVSVSGVPQEAATDVVVGTITIVIKSTNS